MVPLLTTGSVVNVLSKGRAREAALVVCSDAKVAKNGQNVDKSVHTQKSDVKACAELETLFLGHTPTSHGTHSWIAATGDP